MSRYAVAVLVLLSLSLPTALHARKSNSRPGKKAKAKYLIYCMTHIDPDACAYGWVAESSTPDDLPTAPDLTGLQAPTTAALNDIKALGKGRYLVVGDHGTIFVYEPGSENPWKLVESPTAVDLNGIWISNGTAIVVGDSGVILAKRLGASPIKLVSTPTTADLLGIWVSNGTAIVVGEGGDILVGGKLRSGKVKWGSVPSELTPDEDLTTVWGRSLADVYVVGDQGTVLHFSKL